MGLVYTTLLSLIPLLAFSFAILKAFGAHRDLAPIVYEFFRPLGEQGAAQITGRVMQFTDTVSGGIVGSLGFALLVWTLVTTINKVEDSINYLWRVEQPRSFARRVTEYLALIIMGPLLLVAFVGLSHYAMSSAAMQRVAEVPLLQQLTYGLTALAPYAVVTAVFTIVYAFVPNTRVQFRAALIGGLVAGAVWAAIGNVFTGMVTVSARLTIVYAGFALVVAALLWTYFGWLILLAGAHLSFYVQNPGYLRIGLQEVRLSAREMERLALRIMFLVGQAHTAGVMRYTVNGLSEELGLPAVAIAQIVRALESAGLIVSTSAAEVIPGRDLGHIGLQEILDVTRNQRGGHFSARGVRIAPVDRLTTQLDEAWRGVCGGKTLRDLLEEAA
jgi:membrane protein